MSSCCKVEGKGFQALLTGISWFYIGFIYLVVVNNVHNINTNTIGLTWKSFYGKGDVTYELLAEQIFQDELANISQQILSIEMVRRIKN